MVTISKTVQEIVNRSPFLREALVDGVINLTGLARKIQPEIEERFLKPASIASIIMALQRHSATLKKIPVNKKGTTHLNADISTRSNITLFTVEYSQRFIGVHKKIAAQLEKERSVFLSISYGITEMSCAVNTEYANAVKKALRDFAIIDTIEALSAITIRFTTDTIHTPGIYYRILQELAWNNVNFIEIMSSGNELTILFDSSTIERAFTLVKKVTSKI